MSIFHYLLLDMLNFYKVNGTGNGRRYCSWDEDDETIPRRKHERNCTTIHQIRLGKGLGGGYIKVAYEGDFLGQKVVLKMKNMKNSNYPGVCGWENFTCAVYRDLRILNELLVMDLMDHPMISRVLGYCIHSGLGTEDFLEEPGVVGVYETGPEVKASGTFKVNWRDRIKHAIAIADFLKYVEHSQFGRLPLYDIDSSQLVMVRSHLCLTDMDLTDNMLALIIH